MLYVHRSLQAKEVKMQVIFQESVFAEIKLNDRDKLLTCCKMRTLIREALLETYSHVLLI